ncbi:hypothetical protein G5I_03481 [Acromyrmex echinatior]|uniref:Uncharacterized protein n=1 Tax=Acromyrmex echinatior TaxID=103372 RepID=F4WD35_ACREC|nr:hypothetical protein G5I_03481 [Acromyrmex echinatior]
MASLLGYPHSTRHAISGPCTFGNSRLGGHTQKFRDFEEDVRWYHWFGLRWRCQGSFQYPEVDSSSTSARRTREKAVELALEYDEQPLCAIAAVVTRELGTIAKAVEKSKNIKGDIVRDLWRAYTKLSAALSSVTRAVDGADRSGFGAWAEEKRKLERELVLLRSRNTFLERNRDRGRSTSRCTAASSRDGAPGIVWDSTMEWSGLESSTGAHSPIRTRSGRTAPAEGEESRHRVAVTEEDLETPYFRPPLQGVSKQMNPLSTATDRRVAPAGGTYPARRRKRKSDGEDEDRRMERILVRPSSPNGDGDSSDDGAGPKGAEQPASNQGKKGD